MNNAYKLTCYFHWNKDTDHKLLINLITYSYIIFDILLLRMHVSFRRSFVTRNVIKSLGFGSS